LSVEECKGESTHRQAYTHWFTRWMPRSESTYTHCHEMRRKIAHTGGCIHTHALAHTHTHTRTRLWALTVILACAWCSNFSECVGAAQGCFLALPIDSFSIWLRLHHSIYIYIYIYIDSFSISVCTSVGAHSHWHLLKFF